MFKLDARRLGAVGNEPDLNLGTDIRVGLPLTVDVPGHDEALRRVPDDDLSDIPTRAIFFEFVPKAAETGLPDCRLPWRLADTVVERPPAAEPRGEDFKRMLLAGADADALAHRRNRHCYRHFTSSFWSLVLSASAWNAASASSQN